MQCPLRLSAAMATTSICRRYRSPPTTTTSSMKRPALSYMQTTMHKHSHQNSKQHQHHSSSSNHPSTPPQLPSPPLQYKAAHPTPATLQTSRQVAAQQKRGKNSHKKRSRSRPQHLLIQLPQQPLPSPPVRLPPITQPQRWPTTSCHGWSSRALLRLTLNPLHPPTARR